MSTQLELFTTDTHEHVYTLHKGPVQTQPPISVGAGRDASRWCWTCHSWVNVVGISQWEHYEYGKDAIAMHYARIVKAGRLSRSDAAWLFDGFNFFESLLAIDIAIGIINAGTDE